ncbi:MAG: peptide chain release factor 1 [Candidatus Kapabacteria bacterium]|nr:peptide chain release factor 1 [Candidatus Kapabacteria bacterium]
MEERLLALIDRFAEVEQSLNDPSVVNNSARLREASREHKSLVQVVTIGREFLNIIEQIRANRLLIDEPSTDSEMRDMAYEDTRSLDERKDVLSAQLNTLLIPRDPNDFKNCIVELRAGTGGDEAALFVGDLFRMYQKYCENRSWAIEPIDMTESERGGFKEITFEVNGDEAYGVLKFESGVHRVQRVPDTESQGRIHTSAATVAVLPEAEEVDVQINDVDLRIDIFRSGGKGGQNLNKVETAVRIVHIPSGIVVQCQDERSQLRNKDKAMKVLRARLYELELEKQQSAIAGARKSMVRSGDRSEKIRTYNWPQNRVTDHRLDGDDKNHPLQGVVDGGLDEIITALRVADSKLLNKTQD